MEENRFISIEDTLKKCVPETELNELKRILYGRSDEWVIGENIYFECVVNYSIHWNIWQNISFSVEIIGQLSFSHAIEIHAKTSDLANEHDFDVRAYSFDAKPEELRSPRIVRVSCTGNNLSIAPSNVPYYHFVRLLPFNIP